MVPILNTLSVRCKVYKIAFSIDTDIGKRFISTDTEYIVHMDAQVTICHHIRLDEVRGITEYKYYISEV